MPGGPAANTEQRYPRWVSCCAVCSWPIVLNRNGRTRLTCSGKCRSKAYRIRKIKEASVTKLFSALDQASTVGLSINNTFEDPS
jgi:hypothetical protein